MTDMCWVSCCMLGTCVVVAVEIAEHLRWAQVLCPGLPGCRLRHWKWFDLCSSRAFLPGAVSPEGVIFLMLGKGGNGKSRQAGCPGLTGWPEKPQVSGLGCPGPLSGRLKKSDAQVMVSLVP